MDNKPCPEALLGALGLCRKAGALALGFDAVLQSLKSKQTALLLFAEDVSEGTRRRLETAAPSSVEIVVLPCSKQALAALGCKPVGALAVTNAQLARLCLSKMLV